MPPGRWRARRGRWQGAGTTRRPRSCGRGRANGWRRGRFTGGAGARRAAGGARRPRAGCGREAAPFCGRAGSPRAAAAMPERAGHSQEAGLLYEQVAAESPADGDDGAVAQLALGRLLGSLGRPMEATRALQAAARHPATRLAAQRRLPAELNAMGLRHAAEGIERRLDGHPALPPSEAPADPGPVPRRFRVIKTLGAGALGRVYEAEDQLLGRTVALKVLSVGAGALGPERQAFQRFLREAEAVGRLRHPRIVALHELD